MAGNSQQAWRLGCCAAGRSMVYVSRLTHLQRMINGAHTHTHTQLMLYSATAFGENRYSKAAYNQALAWVCEWKKGRERMHLGQRYTSRGNFGLSYFFGIFNGRLYPSDLVLSASYISKGRLRHPVMSTQGRRRTQWGEKLPGGGDTHTH